MNNLSYIVREKNLIKLIHDFLYMQIVDDKYGMDVTQVIGCGIPSVDILTRVLLNFALIDFDNEFKLLFPYG